jgi:hypothetical protein
MRKNVRTLWDYSIRTALLSKGRWPGSDSFVAKRISGPGMSSNYFYQIHPELAVMAFHAKLESLELNLIKEESLREARKPLNEFYKFFDDVVGPFGSVTLNKKLIGPIEELVADNTKEVLQVTDARKVALNKLLDMPRDRNLVKLSEQELLKTLKMAEQILRSFYADRIVSKLDDQEVLKFWRNYNITEGDYASLTSKLFAEVFAEDFLEPLEVTDESFVVDVFDQELSKYFKDLIEPSFSS